MQMDIDLREVLPERTQYLGYPGSRYTVITADVQSSLDDTTDFRTTIHRHFLCPHDIAQ